MALAKALWLCLLPGISLVGTGSVHASNWLLKGPGCLCALQQAGGTSSLPRAWRGAGADPPLRSTPHRSETSTQHCSVWSESLKAAVVLIFLGWTVMRPLIVGSHAISCITRCIKRRSANSSCTLRSCCLHVYLKGLAVKPVKSTSDGK